MICWRQGLVAKIGSSWAGAVELEVTVAGEVVPALAYQQLVGPVQVGDAVLLNVSAWQKELGTGGYALVVAVPERLPADLPLRQGHLVKARYTPLQATVLGVDEPDSPHYELLRLADDLAGMPVVVADLHSALPAILAGIFDSAATARVAYVMTDGAALPLAFSRTVAELRRVGWLAGSITTGQTFGGDLEAVTLHTGLLAARLVLQAQIAVVVQGPGNLGTGTRWGFSGVAVGDAVNATSSLGGRPVGSLRVSVADARSRHRGVSHHSLTAYGRVALATADLVLPDLPEPLGTELRSAVEPLQQQHRLVTMDIAGLERALRQCPVSLSTMGRGLDEDPAYFLAAAAAGRHAAELLNQAMARMSTEKIREAPPGISGGNPLGP